MGGSEKEPLIDITPDAKRGKGDQKGSKRSEPNNNLWY